ncbi:hypothetical protein C4572_02715 [Candidatus Parcubacteria bacterium]|nr:MAG: hypothetical protein C4572_02715 [Candidatus Parcubacteria bacterium]
MNKESTKQYMDTLRERYLKAGKKEKGLILDEYCRNLEQERKYAIKKFNYKVKLKETKKRGKNITTDRSERLWPSCGRFLTILAAKEWKRS